MKNEEIIEIIKEEIEKNNERLLQTSNNFFKRLLGNIVYFAISYWIIVLITVAILIFV